MGLARSLTPDIAVTDAKAFTAWLDLQPSVHKSRKMGRVGYCVGRPTVSLSNSPTRMPLEQHFRAPLGPGARPS